MEGVEERASAAIVLEIICPKEEDNGEIFKCLTTSLRLFT